MINVNNVMKRGSERAIHLSELSSNSPGWKYTVIHPLFNISSPIIFDTGSLTLRLGLYLKTGASLLPENIPF
jgi:hypothetical protein